MNDGTMYSWGWNPHGELGDGTINMNALVPQQVRGDGGTGLLANIAQVDAGEYVSSACGEDGSVWTWGGNYASQLGRAGSVSSLGRVVGVGGTGTLPNVVHVDAAYDHIAALLGDGSVVSWGENLWGAIGDGNAPSDATSPTAPTGPGGTGSLTNVIAITTTDYYSTFALLGDGSVFGWGWNNNGEMGYIGGDTCNTNRNCQFTPIQIPSLDLF
ncbi:MAG: hypothetical protein HRU17_20810 [Polyangiaceae bacterium]|nr:hypothetical protein [Polyangiaceae bacterium]